MSKLGCDEGDVVLAIRTHSKSRYCSGLQCLRLFYIEMKERELIPEPDIATQFTFDQGNEVGGVLGSYVNCMRRMSYC